MERRPATSSRWFTPLLAAVLLLSAAGVATWRFWPDAEARRRAQVVARLSSADPDERWAAARVLERIRGPVPAAVAPLGRLLGDRKSGELAVELLWRQGAAGLREMRRVRKNGIPAAKAQALHGLAGSVSNDSPARLKLVLDGLKDEDREVQCEAADLIHHMSNMPIEVIAGLEAAYDRADDDRSIWVIAMAALYVADDAGDRSLASGLWDRLRQHGESFVRENAQKVWESPSPLPRPID